MMCCGCTDRYCPTCGQRLVRPWVYPWHHRPYVIPVPVPVPVPVPAPPRWARLGDAIDAGRTALAR